MKASKFNARRFKFGSLATVVTLVVIVAIVFVNIIAGLLLDRFPVKLDITANKKFQVSDKSVEYLKTLDEDVKIIVCADEADYQNAGILFKQSYEIIKKYQSYNSKIDVSFVNLTKNPSFAQAYDAETLEAGQVIVESSKRYKILDPNDLFLSNTDTETQATTYQSQAEQALTGAIMNVTDSNPTTATILSGTSEVDTTALQALLKSNNYIIEGKNIFNEELNADADLLIIPQPKADFTVEQIEKINKFLSNDGKYGKSVYFIASPTDIVGPVLKNFLADWGMEVSSEVLLETNQNNMYMYQNFIVTRPVDEDTIKNMSKSSLPMISPNTHAIKTLFDSKDARKTTALVTTDNTAVLASIKDTETTVDTSKLTKDTYNTVVRCTRTNNSDEGSATSNVVVFGSGELFVTDFLTFNQVSNGDLALTVANDLVGKEDVISIIPVDMSSQAIVITQQQVVVNAIVLVLIIPAVIIASGIIIWVRRRHL